MQGKVKFYSSDKGYGFIHSAERGDVYFHITAVNGAEPPKVGDVVKFDIGKNQKTGKEAACDVDILQQASNTAGNGGSRIHSEPRTDYQYRENSYRPPKVGTLNGFPCVRGDHINGFRVQRSLGRITVGNGLFSYPRNSANEAREALILEAKRIGANAVLNYVWHNNRQRVKGVFGGWRNVDKFWSEGEAVVLVAD